MALPISLSDVLKDVNIRVKNQIVLGFLCSFVVVNWHFFIVLFSFSKEDYISNGYVNLLTYMKCFFNWENALFKPLGGSLAVNLLILILDVIFNLVKHFFRILYIKAENLITGNEDAYVKFGKYMEKVEEMKVERQKINDELKTQKELEEKNTNLTVNNRILKDDLSAAKNEINILVNKVAGLNSNIESQHGYIEKNKDELGKLKHKFNQLSDPKYVVQNNNYLRNSQFHLYNSEGRIIIKDDTIRLMNVKFGGSIRSLNLEIIFCKINDDSGYYYCKILNNHDNVETYQIILNNNPIEARFEIIIIENSKEIVEKYHAARHDVIYSNKKED